MGNYRNLRTKLPPDLTRALETIWDLCFGHFGQTPAHCDGRGSQESYHNKSNFTKPAIAFMFPNKAIAKFSVPYRLRETRGRVTARARSARGGLHALGGGLPPSETPALLFFLSFCILKYLQFVPGSSRCYHLIDLVALLLVHPTSAP